MSDAVVVTAEFHIKPGQLQRWLDLMLTHYGPACVVEEGMLRYWLHQDELHPEHVLLYEQWSDRSAFQASLNAEWRASYHADTEGLWARPRVMTTYRRVDTSWDPLDESGLPVSMTREVGAGKPVLYRGQAL